MQISVSGEQHVKAAPERAELALSVTSEGPDRAALLAEVTAAANQIHQEMSALHDGGSVERFSMQPLRTYSWRRNRSAAERVTASVDLTASFSDFEALGRYTADLGARNLVRLGWVNWTLTDATADRLRDECIAGAVLRARHRAKAMARAAGAGPIEIVEIADPGLMGSSEAKVMFSDRRTMSGMARQAMIDRPEPEVVQVVPQEIEIGAQLQLRFTTS